MLRERFSTRVSKGPRANNCHGPRLALIRHWFAVLIMPRHRTTIGGTKRCCDLSVAFSDSFPFARWQYARVAISNAFDWGKR